MTTGGEGRSGSGTDALAGFDYQVDVSIWLALELVLANRLADAIELEPASEEDIEADLADDEAGPVVSKAGLAAAGKPYRLVVQAKLRSGDPWSVSDVNRLLEHGERRMPVAARLKDSDIRYLLVTSAALNAGAKALRTNSLSVWPQDALPATTAGLLPPDAAGRIAIMSNLEPELLRSRIKVQLTETLRVPYALWEACLDALRSGAGSRVRRMGTNIWTRADLEEIVTQHEGHLASSPDLDDYVPPTNWHALRSQVKDRHAVLIIGQSGTGKTLATDKLFDELSAETPGMRRVRIRTPEELRQYALPGPAMFDIEDPWGRYTLDTAGRGWVAELPGLMARARRERPIVATSRLDIGKEAKALERLGPYVFPLEAEHYGPRERRALYERRVERLKQTALRQLALAGIRTVLKELDTPLQIQKFFDALRVADLEEARTNPLGVIRSCIGKAHEDSIEATIALQVEERREVRAAAVLWGMMLDRQSVSFEDLLIVEDALYRADATMENGVTPLAHFLVSARNLRQKDNLLSIYHPRDESGLLKAIQAKALPARATLARLVEILATTRLGDGRKHLEKAAILVDACRRAADLPLALSPKAQAAIDGWLTQEMAEPGRDLERQLRLAASVGSEASVEGEIARWLEHRPRADQFAFMMDWGAPRRPKAWREWIRSAAATRPLMERFIREMLPVSRDSYGISFVRASRLLAGDVTQAFVDGAYCSVEYGILRSETTLFRGAFADLDGCGKVVDHALDVLTPTAREEDRWETDWLAIANDEYSPGYMESLSDDDGGFTARAFLGSYVAELRDRRGWEALRDHTQVSKLLSDWLRHLRRPETTPSVGELEGLLPLVEDREEEAEFWDVARGHWAQPLQTALVVRVVQGSRFPAVRNAAAACLLEHARHTLPSVVLSLVEADSSGRLADLALEIGRPLERPPGSDGPDPIDALPEPFRTISERSRTATDDRTRLDGNAITAIAALPPASGQFRSFRVALAGRWPGVAVRDDVTWILAHTDDVEDAVSAVSCAIARGWTDMTREALQHRFAKVAATALRALAPAAPTPLPADLLSLAKRDLRNVRETLVELIEARPSPGNVPTLLELTEDRHSNAETHDDGNSLPIAIGAINVLARYPLPERTTLERLCGTAIETDDRNVRGRIFTSLAEWGEPGQRLLLDLVISKEKAGPRIVAVEALRAAATQLADAVIVEISAPIVLRLHPRLAAPLILIVAWRGTRDQVESLADSLSSKSKWRVFLALLAAGRLHTDPGQAAEVAAHLPYGHFARQWALGESVQKPDDEVLNDLGSVAAVTEVLPYLAFRNQTPAQRGEQPTSATT